MLEKKEHQGSCVFLVEDDPDVSKVISARLKNDGFSVESTAYGLEALERINRIKHDVVLLDLGLPDSDGLDICKQIKTRQETNDIPVLILTGRARSEDEVKGLNLGAEDFIRKPFDGTALLIRIHNTLRRKRELKSGRVERHITVGDLVLHVDRQMISVQGKHTALTRTEFCLLLTLAENVGVVMSRAEIAKAAKEFDVHCVPSYINLYMNRLRKKLGPVANYIETIYKSGYRLKSLKGGSA